ncbi:Arc-like DNA binding domain protein [Citrobacter koseri]|uniref:Arc-like DNA binding domain protein n=1 Tax=Citrobacter koseri TaxID=545 RepID=A0A078L8C2_CITKO|nr:Arc family DNA-binding protein [Citrobacter koseri]CDZ82965.1 Arc-like DNA binding domain protein [Citrobacter koseri]HEM8525129.1 Arc family DNA-binding protein [Citrobacter koseri]
MKGASLISPLGVRIPEELKEKIQAQAKENGRSTNAEIVQILENSFSLRDEGDKKYSKEMSSHQQSLLSMKDEIIETQKETISHMENTINSLNEHINILKDHVEFLKKQYK